MMLEKINKLLKEFNKEFNREVFKSFRFIGIVNNIEIYELIFYPSIWRKVWIYKDGNITFDIMFGRQNFKDIDDFIEYFKINYELIFYNIFICDYIKKNTVTKNDILHKESDIEIFIINNINLTNFNVFFYNLSKKHQEQYKYLINAKKFDLI